MVLKNSPLKCGIPYIASGGCILILEGIKLKLFISKSSDSDEKLITHLSSIIRELGRI